ncbi:uncharacterized protein LOC101861250 isoform X6 [Aplysia californica]|uniref:Uncharacterized protein LOC101861250 isoform X6 n=1 Tax=Aplysia californica TaxID=6500 RepID=A0ABM1W392_APLCA|nr:uncharacterized protein LOC101861250 isoform X6 [Aplysia californica]
MSGEEQPQPFASDEEMISESSRTHYHVWRGTAPAVCQRRGDDLGIFADAVSCLERNSPSRLPATRRCSQTSPPHSPPCGSRKYRASPWRKGVTLCSNQKGGRENDGSGNGPLSGWNRAANTVLRRA